MILGPKCWEDEIHYQPPWFHICEHFETIKDSKTRSHFITFVAVTNDIDIFSVENYLTAFPMNGHLKWFDKYPDDLIPEQKRYRKYFRK